MPNLIQIPVMGNAFSPVERFLGWRTGISPQKKLPSSSGPFWRARSDSSASPRGIYETLSVQVQTAGFQGLILPFFVSSSIWEGQDTKLKNDFQSYKVRSVCRSLGANKEDLTLLFSSHSTRTPGLDSSPLNGTRLSLLGLWLLQDLSVVTGETLSKRFRLHCSVYLFPWIREKPQCRYLV